MQLVAYGASDVYLTGDPKVTFFQSAYKRHTNFAMETVQQTVSGNAGPGGLVSVTLARSGDLVGDMFVVLQPNSSSYGQLTSNNVANDMNWVAERAFSSVELFIGGQSIDKHYQLWFRLYAEVFLNETKKMNYGKMASIATPNNAGTSIAYAYLPLMILPLYASMERLDPELREAASNLGASPMRTFRDITWPLTLPGAMIGAIFVFVPSLGNFVVPELLGGGKTVMVGNLIRDQFLKARDWPFGAVLALSVIGLLVALFTAQAMVSRRITGKGRHA